MPCLEAFEGTEALGSICGGQLAQQDRVGGGDVLEGQLEDELGAQAPVHLLRLSQFLQPQPHSSSLSILFSSFFTFSAVQATSIEQAVEQELYQEIWTWRAGAERTEPSRWRTERKSIASPSRCSGSRPTRREKVCVSRCRSAKGLMPQPSAAARAPSCASCLRLTQTIN